MKENLIGYISRYKNEAIARMLDSGVRLVAYMDEKEYCLPEMEECSVNEYLKGEIDALYQICDQLQELYENGEKKEHKIRDILTFDLERFMMFLTASDGVISWQEAELFEIYLGHSLTPKKIHC